MVTEKPKNETPSPNAPTPEDPKPDKSKSRELEVPKLGPGESFYFKGRKFHGPPRKSVSLEDRLKERDEKAAAAKKKDK